jgi:spore germination protein GerM
MSRRTVMLGAIAVAAIGGALWWTWWALAYRRAASASIPGTSTTSTAAPAAARKITATLYFVSEDGLNLVGVQHEVAFGETVLDQAREIVNAQLALAPPPLASAIPPTTKLRALYVTERGDAFVDLSSEARTKHTGGALDELFTVYSIVNALTTNLPAVTRVQLLIEGKEVDTLAGHVDLRHPLQKNLKWVRTEKGQT